MSAPEQGPAPRARPSAGTRTSPYAVDRGVRALLSRLTPEQFQPISDLIIVWANKSEEEQDGRTLCQVIRLVYERAIDRPTGEVSMYARLCRKMMEQISPDVRDDGIKNAEGKPIAGGQLFRKYLLNRCQEDFKRGWVAKEATAAAAATKATEDQAAKAAAEGKEDGESALYSEEYYAAQKAKRQGLGLIKFIGELFKLQMLTERIMHKCVKTLLGNVKNPKEEEIESLCVLLTTVGQILDTPKVRAHMDVYFSRMKELCKNPKVNSRMQFMLQDVIELRERKWVPRNQAAAPTTIAALREQVSSCRWRCKPTDQSFAVPHRGGSQPGHGRRASSTAMPPPGVSRQGSVGLGISGFQNRVNPFTMGQFSTPKMSSSEERFAAAIRSASMSGGPGLPFGRSAPTVRSSSQGGPSGSGRTRSQRGGKRDKDRPGQGPGQGSASGPGSSLANSMSLEPVAPLEFSANRWTPSSLNKKGQAVEQDSPEVVDRKVRALLNKLTMERFDSISDQIIAWANKSEKEQDGRTLIQVIRLVFERATDEATWSAMYARLCRKMMEQISPDVRDDGIKNAEGKPLAGGQLFRKHLLNRCQEDFERGWVAKEETVAAAATKAREGQAVKAAAEDKEGGESALYSEEYYAAEKAKRQGLGLIQFMGELFKLQMLTERIMHECVKTLLGNVENPEEEEIESLCTLMTTVGQILDTPKARAHMDVYCSRMKELCKSPNVNSRMQFMLQDVIELRERKWVPRNQAAAPTTIAALREQIEKEKAASDKDAMKRTMSMSRGGSRRGGDRGDHQQIGPDGWAVAGGAAPRQPPKAGDLSNFGKINKSTPRTFGPSSLFQKDKSKSRESTLSRQGSTNMSSMLSANPETAGSDDEGTEYTSWPSMSLEEAKTLIEEDSKELFSIRDLDEAEVYFTKLPAEHHHMLVDKLITKAVESKEADAQLVAGLYERAHAKNLCASAAFEKGFNPLAEVIYDNAIYAPKAPNLFAIMLKGAHSHEDEERPRVSPTFLGKDYVEPEMKH